MTPALKVLLRCLVLLTTALAGLMVEARAADGSRPNFVFLFADDQRYDALGVVQREQGDSGRFPWFKTPNLDRLAAEGVRFRNAFVVNSLCSPSRACFLSGQYSHRNGICDNKTPLSESLPTHATLLQQHGYSTGYVGKWHMGSNQKVRPGFDWYASFTGQGLYFNAAFLVNGTVERADVWTDDRSGDYAVRFLESERDKSKPFLLVVGFKAPHGPFTPPKRLDAAFAGEKARTVPSLSVWPGFNRDLTQGKTKPDVGREPVPVNLDYFRCIAGVDENVGKVLDALERLGLSGNTVVICSSDNGFYLQEHGLGDKRSAYEESLRIPLLVRDPRSGAKGATRDDLVLNIDLAPTLLDLAGLDIPSSMQGKSWKPLLKAESSGEPLRSNFFFEYFRENGGPNAASSIGGYNTPTLTGVRTVTHKLIRYRDHPEWTELYDLASDPYECRNLSNDEQHAELRRCLEAEHDRLAEEVGYRIPKEVPPEPRR